MIDESSESKLLFCVIDSVVCPSLRHSCLSHYGRLGFSVFQLRAISGHRSVRMLERYVKVDSLSVLGAMDKN